MPLGIYKCDILANGWFEKIKLPHSVLYKVESEFSKTREIRV